LSLSGPSNFTVSNGLKRVSDIRFSWWLWCVVAGAALSFAHLKAQLSAS
jgi:hypothetical protein